MPFGDPQNGAGGVHALLIYPGALVPSIPFYGTADSNISLAANDIILVPFLPIRTFSIDALLLRTLTTVGGRNMIALIYTSQENNGLPDRPLIQSAAVLAAGTAVQTIPFSFTFTPAIWWIGIWTSATASIRTLDGRNIAVARNTFTNDVIAGRIQATIAGFGGNAPNPWVFAAAQVPNSDLCPLFYLRAI